MNLGHNGFYDLSGSLLILSARIVCAGRKHCFVTTQSPYHILAAKVELHVLVDCGERIEPGHEILARVGMHACISLL
jgi:hypothetical protein